MSKPVYHSSVEHKRRYFEECRYPNGFSAHWLQLYFFAPLNESQWEPKLFVYQMYSKYLLLCPAEVRNAHRFWTTWRWVNYEWIFIFVWTVVLKVWWNLVVSSDSNGIFFNIYTWSVFSFPANNSGITKRQITDLVDQSIQINTHCFVVTADNRYILACGFWDKSFRVYSTETGACVFCDVMPFVYQLVQIKCLCAHMVICSLFIQGNSLRSCLVTGMWLSCTIRVLHWRWLLHCLWLTRCNPSAVVLERTAPHHRRQSQQQWEQRF